MENNHIRAHRNELAVLTLLHRYGHVRQTDIGRAVWPKSAITTAKSMTARTLARLMKSKQVFRMGNPLGGYSYLLTWIGANRVGLSLEDDVRSGRGITSVTGPHFIHRTLGTRYLIEKEADGLTAYGEYAIYRGLAGLNRDTFTKPFKKIPDGLVLVNGTVRGLDPGITAVDWVEVESYYKPPVERRKIIALCEKFGTWIDRDRKLLLDRIVFVYSSMNAHEPSLLSGIDSYVREHKITNPQILSKIVLARCDIRPPFIWVGYTEVSWLQMQRMGLPGLDLEEEHQE